MDADSAGLFHRTAMFRTLLVLLFLAACGVYFHQNGSVPVQSQSDAKSDSRKLLDDSSLQALKEILPARLFEKDVQPALEQNRKEGLTAAQIGQLLDRLNAMSRELGGKAAEAVDATSKKLEAALPGQEKSPLEKSADAAGALAQKAGEGLKENMPAVRELAENLLSGMIAVLSQILSSAADLMKK